MLHIVPILCLIFFIWFIEVRLKKEIHRIEQDLKDLKSSIKNNSNKINKIWGK